MSSDRHYHHCLCLKRATSHSSGKKKNKKKEREKKEKKRDTKEKKREEEKKEVDIIWNRTSEERKQRSRFWRTTRNQNNSVCTIYVCIQNSPNFGGNDSKPGSSIAVFFWPEDRNQLFLLSVFSITRWLIRQNNECKPMYKGGFTKTRIYLMVKTLPFLHCVFQNFFLFLGYIPEPCPALPNCCHGSTYRCLTGIIADFFQLQSLFF